MKFITFSLLNYIGFTTELICYQLLVQGISQFFKQNAFNNRIFHLVLNSVSSMEQFWSSVGRFGKYFQSSN